MTQLNTLRRQLGSLRRWRAFVRLVAACSATGTAIVLILAGLFAVDFVFEMDVVQRLIVMAIGVLVAVWAFAKFTRPMLGRGESMLEVALMVERQHAIPSDLVAAIQFESPEAAAWGSRQLELAVIDRVASIGRRLDVFDGFSKEQMVRRGLLLAAVLGVGAVAITQHPDHTRAFLNRMLLGSQHYPSATGIDRVAVNHQLVLQREQHGAAPSAATSPEGQAVSFAIVASGRTPAAGVIKIRPVSGAERVVDLQRLTLDERRARLTDAAERLKRAIEENAAIQGGAWLAETAALVRSDAPDAADVLLAADGAGEIESLKNAADSVDAALKAWPGKANGTAVFVGRLARLNDPLDYQIYLGDAWTDPATLAMTPLPIIETKLTPVPPEYARGSKDATTDAASRQLAVLEGSQVHVGLTCTNGKPLERAWLVITNLPDRPRFDLKPLSDERTEWELDAAATPFSPVLREVRFDLQVLDRDGLQLDVPISGLVRIKADRGPTCAAEVVHRVVLPAARPVVKYRAGDDYGIAKLVLHATIERGDNSSAANGSPEDNSTNPGERVAAEEKTFAIVEASNDPSAVPSRVLSGEYPLDLRPLNLIKGDRLKLTLEAIDYRGITPGKSYLSDPLVIEISDESGVLAAISEADERSEQRLTDIIKQQLGIGESP